ncbi:TetR/AcrR family transcriptional regulator C-terminal domain-containing protein [Streptomyces kunmingensis]|uniref:TetR/AcrR family transcriptional regulator C-terminal domain-containing protein n=1 Tax=Streptomyces kunmingensis TaxID=68225 RepID=A0ABU6CJW8_9ACTN|nr:TetR/AcrR family transcriptional regulator C-terminal domain-containing protein [Streptomyces kunmingensis]MEB3964988.1 TetR/AcrR family transcriptional regulator C-terminal domain-containing protein [Streptomyces kunmingensis]
MPADEKPTASVWTRPSRPQREQLTREQIVTAAIDLLDKEGTEALSMRKLGSRLDAGATSLYRHVANRDELIQLVVDDVYGEIELPATAGRPGWRAAVTGIAADLRAMTLRHPWIAPELGQVGLVHIGPNAMRMTSGLFAQFDAAGFPPGERERAAGTVTAYVIGIATSEAAYLSLIARSGKTEREWVASLRPAFDEASQHDPRLREADSAQPDVHPRETRDADFSYGLERVLDGLSARLDH